MLPVADTDLAGYLDQIPSASGNAVLDLRTYFGCLATALQYLHEQQIRHKDIKPQNILIENRNVLLTDFGLSLDFSDASGSTTSGASSKTLRYCAPEVAARNSRNTSSDIWPLGCVFLEMTIVLKGKPTSLVKEYFEKNGTKEPYYHSNTEATFQLLDVLESTPDLIDSKPIVWIRQMLGRDRDARPTAARLAEMVISPDFHDSLPTTFCGICCLGDEDSRSYRSAQSTSRTGPNKSSSYEGDPNVLLLPHEDPTKVVVLELVPNEQLRANNQVASDEAEPTERPVLQARSGTDEVLSSANQPSEEQSTSPKPGTVFVEQVPELPRPKRPGKRLPPINMDNPSSPQPVETPKETLDTISSAPLFVDRWAHIRQNARERAARITEKQADYQSSQSGVSMENEGESAKEEIIESRVARTKARVTNFELERSEEGRVQSRDKSMENLKQRETQLSSKAENAFPVSSVEMGGPTSPPLLPKGWDALNPSSISEPRIPRYWKQEHTLESHGDSVWSVAFSPDGKQVASASRDKTVRLWDPAMGSVLQTLKGHDDSVLSVAFSPDGKQVASASRDETVKLWDPATGSVLQTLKGHGDSVLSVAFSPDGKQVASASRDKTVRLWDPAMGVPPLKEGTVRSYIKKLF